MPPQQVENKVQDPQSIEKQPSNASNTATASETNLTQPEKDIYSEVTKIYRDIQPWARVLISNPEKRQQFELAIDNFSSLSTEQQKDVSAVLLTLHGQSKYLSEVYTKLFGKGGQKAREDVKTAYEVIHGSPYGQKAFNTLIGVLTKRISPSNPQKIIDEFRETVVAFSHPEKLNGAQRSRYLAIIDKPIKESRDAVNTVITPLKASDSEVIGNLAVKTEKDIQQACWNYDRAREAAVLHGKFMRETIRETASCSRGVRAAGERLVQGVDEEQLRRTEILYQALLKAPEHYRQIQAATISSSTAKIVTEMSPQAEKGLQELGKLREEYIRLRNEPLNSQTRQKAADNYEAALWSEVGKNRNSDTVVMRSIQDDLRRAERNVAIVRGIRDGVPAAAATVVTAILPGTQELTPFTFGVTIGALAAIRTASTVTDDESSFAREGAKGALKDLAKTSALYALSAASKLTAIKLGSSLGEVPTTMQIVKFSLQTGALRTGTGAVARAINGESPQKIFSPGHMTVDFTSGAINPMMGHATEKIVSNPGMQTVVGIGADLIFTTAVNGAKNKVEGKNFFENSERKIVEALATRAGKASVKANDSKNEAPVSSGILQPVKGTP